MAGRLAHSFHHHGVQAGDRVLFHLLNGSELVVGIFAALKAGAVFSVVDYANTFDSLCHIVADCQPAALVTYDHQADSAERLRRETPSLRCVVLIGTGGPRDCPNILSFDAIQQHYPPDVPIPTTTDLDPAYLVYTSGSTGGAKGVLVTHRSSLFTIDSALRYFGLGEHDVHVSPLPLSFSPGINQLLLALRAGGTLVLERSFAFPITILKRMAEEKATGFAGVPTILALLLQMELSRYDLSHLRFVSSIGAALPLSTIRQIRQKLPKTLIFSTYGLAEASYSLGLDPMQIDRRPTSVGKPLPGMRAWVAGEDGQPLGPNQTGELVVGGDHVRSGYWNDPTASARRFRPGAAPGESICLTGDQFRMDEEGYFHFVSRSDEIIKSGAKKVVPSEIENALYSLPGVLEAAAVGVSDPLLGQVIKAFVVPAAHARDVLKVEDILRHCRQSLEEFKVPRQIEITDSLPKTSSGKIKHSIP